MAGKQADKKPAKRAAPKRAAQKKNPAKRVTAKTAGTRARKKSGTMEDRVAQAVEHAIEKLQGKLLEENTKPSVSDLVRLLQLKKELEGDRPKDVRVIWVNEWNDDSANEK